MRLTALLPAALLALTLAVAPSDATALGVDEVAVTPAEDTRWLPWYGCWEATDSESMDGAQLLVCFDPLPGSEGVRIRTLVDGELLATEEIIADGVPVPAEDGGCEGTRVAEWSSDGSRAFVRSELACAEGVSRSTAGVMALARDGTQWIEIHSVRVGDREEVLGMRSFRPASAETIREQGLQPPAEERALAIRTARTLAAGPLSPVDVVEVSEQAGAGVARVLVAEVGQPFDLDARAMRELTRQGLPGEVLDVMVAVSWPERFEVRSGVWEAERATPRDQVAARDDRPRTTWPDRPVYHPDAYVFSPMSHGWFLWSYGFSPRSSFWRYSFMNTAWGPMWAPGFGWGPGSWGAGGRFMPLPSGVHVRDRQARVNPITGYSSNADSDRRAAGAANAANGPNTNTISGVRLPSTIRSAVSPGSGYRGGSSTGATTSSGGSSSSGSDTGRRAIPRTSGGG